MLAFGVGWQTNGWRIEAQMAEQAEEQRHATEQSNQTIIAAYRVELELVRNRPPRRVLLCPDVPRAAGGTPDPAEAGVSGGGPRDIGYLLAECHQYASQLSALIEAVRRPAP